MRERGGRGRERERGRREGERKREREREPAASVRLLKGSLANVALTFM